MQKLDSLSPHVTRDFTIPDAVAALGVMMLGPAACWWVRVPAHANEHALYNCVTCTIYTIWSWRPSPFIRAAPTFYLRTIRTRRKPNRWRQPGAGSLRAAAETSPDATLWLAYAIAWMWVHDFKITQVWIFKCGHTCSKICSGPAPKCTSNHCKLLNCCVQLSLHYTQS